jgi:two-component system, cell cycle response regulator DivK
MIKRILVVEDQEDNRGILRDLLASADYEVTEAENGEEALAAVAKERPDLILMDIQLPILDGYEVTRRIKADPTFKNVPIIAVTSYALSGVTQSAAQALGLRLFVLNVTTDSEVAAAFATMVAQRVGAVLAAGRDGEAECLGSLSRATARPVHERCGRQPPRVGPARAAR